MACQCLRVDQLDANVLDDEIRILTQNSIDEVVQELPIRISRFCEKIRPEIHIFLDAILWTNLGGTSTISETILGLRNWNNQEPMISNINYDTQNRELLWHTFRDALLLILPIARFLRQKIIERRQKFATSSSSSEFLCATCQKPPVAAMRGATCGHVACYYCWCAAGRVCPTCLEENQTTRDVRDAEQKMMVFWRSDT
ncbi:unnamed protein product [Caenorhabditis angaria]|uniref:RING-type domain-containing protein n=1 Tax=Caenorhabditis angaria TaxID=860376 RepID=A0A9P1ILS6_9PELO|nr:unnamed protein product [Caenorhabditis angaria]